MKRAVFYARVSTEKEDQLNSIELQIEENRKAVKSNGWELVDEYIDRGKSGRQVKHRDEYQRLFDDMELDKFDIIVVKDQDRLQRNTKDWYIFVDCLVVNHLELFFYMENKFYTPDNALITGIKAIMAEDFSRNLSKKLRNFNNGRIEKAKAGDKDILLHGIGKAFGWDQKDGVITLNPEQSKVRRLACELTLKGKGSTEVAMILNDEGYRNTVGNPWKTADIPRMVYDHLNVGTVILNQKRHDFEAKKYIYTDPTEWVYLENAIPPIVSKEEWERLLQIKDQRTTVGARPRGKKAGKSQFFSGKLICGCCGKPYWRKTKPENGQEFWVCSTKQQNGRMTRARDAVAGKKGEDNPKGCDNTNISTNALMDILDASTHMLSVDKDRLKEGAEKWLKALRKRIVEANTLFTEADLNKELQRKDRLLDSLLDGVISKADYSRKADAVDSKIKAIQQELKQNEKKLDDVAEIDRLLSDMDKTISEYLDDSDNLEIQFILDKMEQVVIYPDKVKIQLPSFSREIVVEKIQYVSDRYAHFQQHDRDVYHSAILAV